MRYDTFYLGAQRQQACELWSLESWGHWKATSHANVTKRHFRVNNIKWLLTQQLHRPHKMASCMHWAGTWIANTSQQFVDIHSYSEMIPECKVEYFIDIIITNNSANWKKCNFCSFTSVLNSESHLSNTAI